VDRNMWIKRQRNFVHDDLRMLREGETQTFFGRANLYLKLAWGGSKAPGGGKEGGIRKSIRGCSTGEGGVILPAQRKWSQRSGSKEFIRLRA